MVGGLKVVHTCFAFAQGWKSSAAAIEAVPGVDERGELHQRYIALQEAVMHGARCMVSSGSLSLMRPVDTPFA